MAAHLKVHAINSATNHDPGTNGTLLGSEAGALAEKAFSSTVVASNIVQRVAVTGDVLVPATPGGADSATSKDYVDAKVATGTTWKELLLVPEQLLNGVSGAILQAELASIITNPAANDNFIISDGATTETFVFKVAAAGAFEVTIGGSVAATMLNLVAKINLSSTLWNAVSTTHLDAYFVSAPANQFVVYRIAYSGAADRLYSTVSVTEVTKVVEFATGTQDYRSVSGTESTLPPADPGAKRFGLGRAFALLQGQETHTIAESNGSYLWDADADIWQQINTGFPPSAGDGINILLGVISVKNATTVAQQKYGALVNTATSTGTGLASTYEAVATDNSDLCVSAANELAIKPTTRLDKVQIASAYVGAAPVYVGELNTALPDLYDFGFFYKAGASSFLAVRVSLAGSNLSDFRLVELTDPT